MVFEPLLYFELLANALPGIAPDADYDSLFLPLFREQVSELLHGKYGGSCAVIGK